MSDFPAEDADEEGPLISLIVMAYDQERYVREAVAGALAQTWTPLEILLSDDCSPDGTFRIMEEMAAAYEGPHRIVLNRNPENLGLVAHMNRCMDLTSGEMIVAAAGDDISEPGRVARLAEPWLADRETVHLVHSAVREIDDDGGPGEIRRPPAAITDPPDPDPLTVVRERANCIGGSAAYDRRVVARLGPLPRSVHVEDGLLFFRACALGRVCFIDEPLLRYRTSGVSAKAASRSPGYDVLLGDRIKFISWRVGNARGLLADMAHLDFPGKAACIAEADRTIARLGFEADMAGASRGERWRALPRAL